MHRTQPRRARRGSALAGLIATAAATTALTAALTTALAGAPVAAAPAAAEQAPSEQAPSEQAPSEQAPSEQALSGRQSERGSVEVVPLTADLRITRAVPGADGQRRVEHETNRLYRDRQGRTRVEDGSSVTITDPAAGSTIVLDTRAGTFRRVSTDTQESAAPKSAAPGSAGAAKARAAEAGGAEAGGAETRAAEAGAGAAKGSDRKIGSTRRQLGTATISGVRAEGKAYTVTTAARHPFPAREQKVTMWTSREIQLPVRTRVVEDSGYLYEQTYTNIRTGSEPAAALFRVPAGYREADAATPRSATPSGQFQNGQLQNGKLQNGKLQNGKLQAAQATCPIDYLDPIIMFTYYPFPIYSPVPAVTDANQGCLFIADAAAYQLPLILVPETPLLLSVDVWGAYYLGDPVPWLPWTAFGSVGFAAASTSDATVVESLVILEIF